MLKLDLQPYHQYLKFLDKDDGRYILDPVRKEYYKVQPEELVRQSWIQFLIRNFDIEKSSLGVEKQFRLIRQNRRFDLVLYRKAKAFVLFEFKSFTKAIRDEAVYQAAQYNIELQVPYIVISNGIEHHAFHIDFEKRQHKSLGDLYFLEK